MQIMPEKDNVYHEALNEIELVNALIDEEIKAE